MGKDMRKNTKIMESMLKATDRTLRANSLELRKLERELNYLTLNSLQINTHATLTIDTVAKYCAVAKEGPIPGVLARLVEKGIFGSDVWYIREKLENPYVTRGGLGDLREEFWFEVPVSSKKGKSTYQDKTMVHVKIFAPGYAGSRGNPFIGLEMLRWHS